MLRFYNNYEYPNTFILEIALNRDEFDATSVHPAFGFNVWLSTTVGRRRARAVTRILEDSLDGNVAYSDL
eukprot:COSAG02_NODE_4210_length_5625_cov_16.612921_3_plen_70_part_00